MFTEDQLLPISALQHMLYCPRQCALIHLEQAWSENRFTAEGNLMHQRAHDGPDESRPGVRITRGMAVRSFVHGLSGQCDIVEFHHDSGTVIPIEYKRGKPKAHAADEVQLCAQALCLEEMLETTLTIGHLFYGKRKRRTKIALDSTLRELTLQTTTTLREMLASGLTPLAEYAPARCDACSLIQQCEPKSLRLKRGARSWFLQQLQPGEDDHQTASTGESES